MSDISIRVDGLLLLLLLVAGGAMFAAIAALSALWNLLGSLRTIGRGGSRR